MSNAIFGATVLPSANTTYNLGSASFKFANIFSNQFTGDLVGNADTATALETARTINGVSFDGTADITIEASIDKTLFISTGLEDSGAGTQFDGGTDVTLRLRNSVNFTDTNLLKWDSTNGQFVNSLVTDNGTTASVGGNLTVTGDLLVQGSTTTISTTNLVVSDKLIVIGDGTETTQAADGSGFNIGTTGVSLTYDLANTSWTSSESLNLSTGKTYKIAGTTVIGSTALGTGIVSSNLTSVGTLTSLTVSGASELQSTLTVGSTLTANGATYLNENVYLPDNKSIHFGGGNDLVIGHDGSNSFISDNGTGGLRLYASTLTFYAQPQNTEPYFYASANGSAYLYYDGASKFYTLSDGAYLEGSLYTQRTVYRDNQGITTLIKRVETILNANGGNVIDTWLYTSYASAEYTISCTNDSGPYYSQFTRVSVMASLSGDVYVSEQNSMYTDNSYPLFSVNAYNSGGTIYVEVTCNLNNSNNDFRVDITNFYR
jgi:hypothetical protein